MLSTPAPHKFVVAAETARSFLFVPGDRPQRFPKALGSGADIVVIDVEDAVAPENKEYARRQAFDYLQAHREQPVAVRINASNTPDGMADDAALRQAREPLMVVLAKAEEPTEIAQIVALLPEGSVVLPLIESALGILNVADIARTRGVARLLFGHLDLSAELGIDPDDHVTLSSARFGLLIASAAAGLAPPVDGVCTDVRDPQVMTRAAQASLRAGFPAKLCIHPAQVGVLHDALRPDPELVDWAQRVVASSTQGAVAVVDGAMVDRPVMLRALSVLARATEAS